MFWFVFRLSTTVTGTTASGRVLVIVRPTTAAVPANTARWVTPDIVEAPLIASRLLGLTLDGPLCRAVATTSWLPGVIGSKTTVGDNVFVHALYRGNMVHKVDVRKVIRSETHNLPNTGPLYK